MVYLISEDSKGGLKMLEYVNEHYFNNKLYVDTCNGIKKAVKYIKNTPIKSDDIMIIVFDKILENDGVADALINLKKHIHDNNLSNIKLIHILCFEYEVIVGNNSELFISNENDVDAEERYIKQLRLLDKSNLTRSTKSLELFDELYEKSRKQIGKEIDRAIAKHKIAIQDREKCIDQMDTVEKMCKLLYTELFCSDTYIDVDSKQNLGYCWKNDCCTKKNMVCQLRKADLERTEKIYHLLEDSFYVDVAKEITKITGIGHNILHRTKNLKSYYKIKSNEIEAEYLRIKLQSPPI